MTFQIIIETPACTAIKYKYEPDQRVFKAKKKLPMGMVFPYAFGFIRGTKGEDGDPLDAMLISSEKFVTGCLVEARSIGALLAEQTEKGKKIRNDRYFFVPEFDLQFSHIKNIRDFGREHTEQLQEFFVNYNKLAGRIFRPLRIVSTASAHASLKKLIQPQ
jgi:inorganic pyrophosphatase